MTDYLSEIEGRFRAATPGPWGWFGNTDTRDIYLATPDRGRQFIMRFRRWGMQGAQPWFNTDMSMEPASENVRYAVAPDAESRDDKRVYRADISAIKHPDAELIAAAPTDITALLGAVRAVLALASYLDTLAPGDQHYAKLFRAAINKHVEGK